MLNLKELRDLARALLRDYHVNDEMHFTACYVKHIISEMDEDWQSKTSDEVCLHFGVFYHKR